MEIILESIHKHYGSVRANNGVSLTVQSGTIHGILGENGAGKSTLMKVLAGFIPKTQGTIYLDGQLADYTDPADAVRRGVGMLYQDPLDFPNLSVLDNFMMGRRSRGIFSPSKRFGRMLEEMCGQFGFELDPEGLARRLTVGERQQLEILRLLSMGVRLLILDEPTTGISEIQKTLLFNALKKWVDEGENSVLLVSHKLEDVSALCRRVSILRRGKVSGEADAPFDTDQVMRLMFGSLPTPPVRTADAPGDEILRMENITAPGGRTGLNECDVTIRKGEMVGLAGLEGSGQGVFLRTAAGLVSPRRGKILIRGKVMNGGRFHEFRQAGAALLPSDRLAEGLVPGMTLAEHAALRYPAGRLLTRRHAARKKAEEKIDAFHIKAEPGSVVESLSGGNQQRLLLSFLPENPALLLLENPIRGLDLESAHGVWRNLQRHARKGAAVVFSSAELDEMMRVADRILVFFDGRIVAEMGAGAFDAGRLGAAIAGKTTGKAGVF